MPHGLATMQCYIQAHEDPGSLVVLGHSPGNKPAAHRLLSDIVVERYSSLCI